MQVLITLKRGTEEHTHRIDLKTTLPLWTVYLSILGFLSRCGLVKT